MIIAIDGPAGSGKTTIAKRLSERLKIFYLDTGATYRVLTLKALEEKVNLNEPEILKKLAQKLKLKIENDRIYLENRDVTLRIRASDIEKNISQVVSYPSVREEMVRLQRDIVKGRDAVVEGRDITTVVFPEAEFKFFIDAALAVRVERRFKQLKSKGIEVDLEEVKENLARRDKADKTRSVGALTLTDDSVYIDTTQLNIEEVINKILEYVKCGGNKKN